MKLTNKSNTKVVLSKQNKKRFAYTALFTAILSLWSCGSDLNAGGPGTGGTGPIVAAPPTSQTPHSHDNVPPPTALPPKTATPTPTALPPKTATATPVSTPTPATPMAPATSTKTPTRVPAPPLTPGGASVKRTNQQLTIQVLSTSVPKLSCNGFDNKISLVNDAGKSTNKLTATSLKVVTTVKNTLDAKNIESQAFCSNLDNNQRYESYSLMTKVADNKYSQNLAYCNGVNEIIYLPNATQEHRAVFNISSGEYRLKYVNKNDESCSPYLDIKVTGNQ